MTNEEMEFTGERFVPNVSGNIVLEHLHRYYQAREIAAGKVVLDIASGEGYGSAILAETALSVTGVDISAEAVAHAGERYRRDNLQYLVGDCAQIPLPDCSVDLVVSFETIEHHDRHEEMLREIKRVLRKDGVLLISSPDKKYYSDELNYANPYHVKELYEDEFKDLINRYFANSIYFGQRIIYGSALFAESIKTTFADYFRTADATDYAPHLLKPVYWIALATDGQLPELASGILEQPLGETEIVQHFNHEVMLRNDQIAELHQARATETTALNQELSARAERVAELESELADTRSRLHERNDEVRTLSGSLRHYQEVADHSARTIEAMRRSVSWRVTQPLRLVGAGARVLLRPVARLRAYIKRYTDYRALQDCPLFDADWYVAQYPDIDRNAIHPLRHYVVHGWREGRDPGPEFDGAYYRQRYPDVAALQEAPLLHYWRHGRAEGRHINAALDFVQPLAPDSAATAPGGTSDGVPADDTVVVSVVIPTYNRLPLLPQLVESWRKVHQHTRCAYEIIFSDDGSTDGSPAYLESIADLPLTVLKNAHGGASAARNSGIQAATGRRILLMGDDIYPDPEIVNIHASLAERLGDETAILGTVDWHPELPLNHLMRHITEIGNEQFSYNRLQDNALTDFRHFYTCNISIDRRFLLRERHLFDETFTEYGFEDIELGYRLARRGMKIFYSSLARGTHYHPYTLQSFRRRQLSSGRMALLFARMHPGVEPVLGIPALRKLAEQPVAKEDDAAWQRREELLQQRCEFYENLATQLPPGLTAGVRTALSDIYARYFKAMYEYSVLQEIGADAALAKAMRNNFDESWSPYWQHLETHRPPTDLNSEDCVRLLAAAAAGESAASTLDEQSRALFDELAFLMRRASGNHRGAGGRPALSYLLRRAAFHLVNNPRHLFGTIARIVAAKLGGTPQAAQAASQAVVRDAVPGLILEPGNAGNDAAVQLFRSVFGPSAALYEYAGGQLVARDEQASATVFFWPDLAAPLPLPDHLLTACMALVENGNHFALISHALEQGAVAAIGCLRNQMLFSADVAPAVLAGSLRNVPFRGRILRLLPSRHAGAAQPLTTLLDASLQVDGAGNFHNRAHPVSSGALYHPGYLPGHAGEKPVVFVLPIFLAVGGVERNTVEIMRQLRDRFDFVVITMERLRPEQGSLAAQAIDVAFRVVEMAEAVDHHGYLRALSELKRACQPDIVWVCNGSPWFCDNAAALRILFSDVPIIDQKVYDANEGWINRHQEAGTMSFDRFIAVNRKIARRFQDDFRIEPGRIDLIYSAVDVARIENFKADNAGADFYRQKFQLPASKKIFTFVARLTTQKQPLAFLELARARLPHEDEYFVMVGDGELAQPVADYIARHQLTNIRRINYIENTLELHMVSDGILFTSAYEGLPIAMIEALAMGVPAFSTDVGDIADILAQYGGGSVYPFGTAPTEVVARFDEWLGKRETYRDNLRQLERDILHRFSSAVISAQYVQCWQQAAAAYGRKIGGPGA